jgi:hypothetical protein
MGWKTIYISGNTGFDKDVFNELQDSNVPFMPGSVDENSLFLYWTDEKVTLRDFKEAIGAKTIFKYRLRFFTSIEEYQSQHTKTTVRFTA